MTRDNAGNRGAAKTKARPKARAAVKTQERSAKARRTRTPMPEGGVRSASFVFRHRVGNAAIFLVLIIAAAQLFNLQGPRAEGLRAEAAGQLKVTDVEKAVRGSIVDRNDDKLAFTIEARALTFQPAKVRKQLAEAKAKTPEAPDPDRRLRDIAAEVALRLNNKPDAKTVLKKLTGQRLVRLPGPRGRSGRRRRHHQEVPRGRLGATGPAPVPGRFAGRQHRGRHRLGRSRPSGTRGFARCRAGRNRRLGHLRPRLRRRGDPGQLPQPPRRGRTAPR